LPCAYRIDHSRRDKECTHHARTQEREDKSSRFFSRMVNCTKALAPIVSPRRVIFC